MPAAWQEAGLAHVPLHDCKQTAVALLIGKFSKGMEIYSCCICRQHFLSSLWAHGFNGLLCTHCNALALACHFNADTLSQHSSRSATQMPVADAIQPSMQHLRASSQAMRCPSSMRWCKDHYLAGLRLLPVAVRPGLVWRCQGRPAATPWPRRCTP